jgi:hypothetical protein
MRASWSLLFVVLGALACSQEEEHPPAADGCDPSTMDCLGPPMSGGLPSNPGGEGGSDSGGDESATANGRVLQYIDDFFDRGAAFIRPAEVSAMGQSGRRVTAQYDGTTFELEGVLKTASNWFMVAPGNNSGMLPTITPLDTRIKLTGLEVGLTSQVLVDGIFQQSLASSERSDARAQIVMRVTDAKGVGVAGVQGSYPTELIVYRAGETWLESAVATDDSGMLFFGNVPANAGLTVVKINLLGAVTASVSTAVAAGATTVVTAVVVAP